MSLVGLAVGLADLVPAIAGYFGGSNGEAVASKVVDVAKSVAGVDSPEKAIERLRLDSESRRKFEIAILGHDQELRRIAHQDRDSARELQSDAIKYGDWLSKNFLYLYSFAITAFVLGYIVAISFFPVPEDSKRWVDTVLGFLLGTLLSSVVTFFYGSSVGSKQKTAQISKVLK